VVLRLGKVIWDGRTSDINHAELGQLFMTGQIGNQLEASTTPPIA
jgi:branched-chain amino acid transport system ATP-binding protein